MEIIIEERSKPDVTHECLKAILLKYGRRNPSVDAHLLSVITVGRIMGADWCSKWAYEFSSENKVGMYFYPTSDLNDQHAVWRQIRFAELLFNLQWIPGYKTRREEWRGFEPEAIVAELESAYYMWACGHTATFVPVDKSGVRTPDFYVTLRFGLECAWEAKARLETLAFDEDRLIGTLQGARKQLPRDKSNIIFVRIPEHWTFESEFEERIQKPVNHLFRNTERAVSVLFHWELWNTPYKESDILGLAGLEFPNLRWDIVTGKRRVMEQYRGFPQGWVHLFDV